MRGCRRFHVRTGIALHVGEALVGNVGSERKIEYTAIGDVVNTTSRLESLNKEFSTDIIASGAVEEAMRERYHFKPLGEKALRGREKPIQLFALLNRK
ncbi:adenylate/guanylate cyclase domain-containing protein [bacterium]|nr:adenylate/guanylate cyclase domain-containing protein [bacterium]